MATFDAALTTLLGFEGFYSDDPNDAGKETWRGISRASWPKWEGWAIVDKTKTEPNFLDTLKADMTLQALVRDFYKTNFWVEGYSLWEQDITNKVFEMVVNAGVGVGTRCLQRACRACGNPVAEDGEFGPRTQHVVLESEPAALLAALKSECAAVYRCDAVATPREEEYLQGWLDRAYG